MRIEETFSWRDHGFLALYDANLDQFYAIGLCSRLCNECKWKLVRKLTKISLSYKS